MTNVEYVQTREEIDRVVESIKHFIEKTGKTVVVEWGTTEAMEKTVGAKA